jgi:hypothetical protein
VASGLEEAERSWLRIAWILGPRAETAAVQF